MSSSERFEGAAPGVGTGPAVTRVTGTGDRLEFSTGESVCGHRCGNANQLITPAERITREHVEVI